MKNDFFKWLKHPWILPGFLFFICFIAFGVFLGQLGFFQDDWHHVYYAYHEGIDGLKRFLLLDSRPLAYLLYNALFSILGYDPAHWHWAVMVLRFLVVLAFWDSANKLWPGQKTFSTWIAVIFAVYPAYPLQALSVAYAMHWTLFLSFALSIWLMLRARQEPGWRNRWTLAAIFTQFLHLLIIEYFVGAELLRPILLWLAFGSLPARERLKRACLAWLPYIPMLLLYGIYRLSFNQIFGYDRFADNVAEQFLASPGSWIIHFSQYAVQDFIYVSFTPWTQAIDPSLFELDRFSTWLMIAAGLGAAASSYFVISRHETSNEPDLSTLRNAVLAGMVGLVVGLLPSWIIGFSVFTRNPTWSGRLALPAMFGASLFWVAWIFLWARNPKYRNLALSLLLGLALIFQFNTAMAFRTSSEKQRQFYWQLYWRAPAITPNTLIAADNEILPYMGYYPTAFAINLLYPKTTTAPQTDYWFNAGLEHINPDTFGKGEPVELSRYASTFNADKDRVIGITFEPSLQQCLWVLRPAYKDIRYLTPEAYTWLKYSSPARIQNVDSAPPPAAIFGEEPPRNWCYYYLKADLAATSGDWQTIPQLWQTAQTNNLRPANGVELLPFIEGFARADDWKQAQKLSNIANTLPPRMPSLLCSTWETLESEESPTPEEQNIIREAKSKIGCQTP